MDHPPLVACGHCGLGNRRTSKECFICGRPLTGAEVELPEPAPVPVPVPVAPVSPPSPTTAASLAPSPEPSAPLDGEAAETMALGSSTDERAAEKRWWDGTRRRSAIVAAAAAAVVAVGGGVWMARGENLVSDPWALRAAVTEEPELAWTWDAGGPIDFLTPMDGGALVVLGAGEVVALDEDGAVRWREELSPMGYATYDAATEAVHVLRYGAVDMTSKVTSLDAATGEERWTVPGEMATTVGDVTIIRGPSELRRIDTADGTEVWSLDVEGFGAVWKDGVFGIEDGDVRSWDLDGNEVWVSKDAVTASSGGNVVALDDFVAVSAPGSDVVGMDSATGEVRWREDTTGGGAGLGAIQPGLAYLFVSRGTSDSASSDDGFDSEQETTLYDRDGEVGTLPTDTDYFAPVAVEIDGDRRIVDLGSGRIFDEDLQEVGTVPPGHPHPTLTGVYDADGDSISYVPYGEDEPVWTLAGTFEDGPVVPGDGFLLVGDDQTVSLYR